MNCEAVFFTFTHFDDSELEDLDACSADSIKLQECLSECIQNFNVRDHDSLTKKEFFSELINLAAQDHSNTKYLLIYVSSHGAPDIIETYDEQISVVDIVRIFAAVSCPKIFLIDACRGDTFDDGCTAEVSVGAQAMPSGSTQASDGAEGVESPSNTSFANNDNLFRMSCALPPQSVLAYSTPPDRCSLFDEDSGSWFVAAFIDAIRLFQQEERSLDILKILTAANQDLATNYETSGEGDAPAGKKTVSHLLNTLHDRLCLDM